MAGALQTIALGQSISLSIASGEGAPGGSVALPMSLTSSGGAQPAGLQWSFSYSSDITGVTVVAGDATKAAQKSVSCSGTKCVIFGLSTAVIGNGIVAVATFRLASKPSSTTLPIQVTEVVAAAVGGTAIRASGGSGSIFVTAPARAEMASRCSVAVKERFTRWDRVAKRSRGWRWSIG